MQTEHWNPLGGRDPGSRARVPGAGGSRYQRGLQTPPLPTPARRGCAGKGCAWPGPPDQADPARRLGCRLLGVLSPHLEGRFSPCPVSQALRLSRRPSLPLSVGGQATERGARRSRGPDAAGGRTERGAGRGRGTDRAGGQTRPGDGRSGGRMERGAGRVPSIGPSPARWRSEPVASGERAHLKGDLPALQAAPRDLRTFGVRF